jgi:hypothetical protein
LIFTMILIIILFIRFVIVVLLFAFCIVYSLFISALLIHCVILLMLLPFFPVDCCFRLLLLRWVRCCSRCYPILLLLFRYVFVCVTALSSFRCYVIVRLHFTLNLFLVLIRLRSPGFALVVRCRCWFSFPLPTLPMPRCCWLRLIAVGALVTLFRFVTFALFVYSGFRLRCSTLFGCYVVCCWFMIIVPIRCCDVLRLILRCRLRLPFLFVSFGYVITGVPLVLVPFVRCVFSDSVVLLDVVFSAVPVNCYVYVSFSLRLLWFFVVVTLRLRCSLLWFVSFAFWLRLLCVQLLITVYCCCYVTFCCCSIVIDCCRHLWLLIHCWLHVVCYGCFRAFHYCLFVLRLVFAFLRWTHCCLLRWLLRCTFVAFCVVVVTVVVHFRCWLRFFSVRCCCVVALRFSFCTICSIVCLLLLIIDGIVVDWHSLIIIIYICSLLMLFIVVVVVDGWSIDCYWIVIVVTLFCCCCSLLIVHLLLLLLILLLLLFSAYFVDWLRSRCYYTLLFVVPTWWWWLLFNYIVPISVFPHCCCCCCLRSFCCFDCCSHLRVRFHFVVVLVEFIDVTVHLIVGVVVVDLLCCWLFILLLFTIDFLFVVVVVVRFVVRLRFHGYDFLMFVIRCLFVRLIYVTFLCCLRYLRFHFRSLLLIWLLRYLIVVRCCFYCYCWTLFISPFHVVVLFGCYVVVYRCYAHCIHDLYVLLLLFYRCCCCWRFVRLFVIRLRSFTLFVIV